MMRRAKIVEDGKKRYVVYGVITISVHTEVIASSPEEARNIAMNDRGMMSLCHQCAGGSPESEWITSGEFDGDIKPSEGEELSVEKADF